MFSTINSEYQINMWKLDLLSDDQEKLDNRSTQTCQPKYLQNINYVSNCKKMVIRPFIMFQIASRGHRTYLKKKSIVGQMRMVNC